MAVVKGVKEKVHLPLYDSIVVKPKEQLGKSQPINIMRFFQDVSGKTKLQTNMQASSLLPHWNTFEARALRVVISDLAPQFSDSSSIKLSFGVVDKDGKPILTGAAPNQTQKTVEVEKFKVTHFVEFKRRVEGPQGVSFKLSQDGLLEHELTDNKNLLVEGEFIEVDRGALKDAAERFGKSILPPNEQIFPNDGVGNVIGKFIYNSVTSFFVGEKTMIQVPTWFFPAGAGPYAENGKVVTHGYPSPEATFRFAEPVQIDAQQNFRVEIEIPEGEVLSDLQKLYGPLSIWVVLDGYMTRDVQ